MAQSRKFSSNQAAVDKIKARKSKGSLTLAESKLKDKLK
jgi:hypothetical protein